MMKISLILVWWIIYNHLDFKPRRPLPVPPTNNSKQSYSISFSWLIDDEKETEMDKIEAQSVLFEKSNDAKVGILEKQADAKSEQVKEQIPKKSEAKSAKVEEKKQPVVELNVILMNGESKSVDKALIVFKVFIFTEKT